MKSNAGRSPTASTCQTDAARLHGLSDFYDGVDGEGSSVDKKVVDGDVAEANEEEPLLCEDDNKVVVAPREEEDTLFETVKYVSEQSVLNASNFQRVDPQAGLMIQVATGYCQDAPQPADPSKRTYVYTYRITIHNLHQNNEYRILGRNYTFRDADDHIFADINPGSEEAMGVVGLTTGTFTGALEIASGRKEKEGSSETADDSDSSSSTEELKRERLDVRYRKYKDQAKDIFSVSLPDVTFRPTAVAVKLQDNFDRFRYFAERVEHLSALGHVDETADDFLDNRRRRSQQQQKTSDHPEKVGPKD
ncbi:hypothetical protein FOZ60_005366 [Perkinsus olseni]|uniref:Uncharacterized protein n=1 Tax=Perkinsus olseni TaxID=32597 RepID=A0A7J6NRX8_PEROL|nr:hypothetical protein FOZ60_005366 [Perkinsus olseni]